MIATIIGLTIYLQNLHVQDQPASYIRIELNTQIT